MTKETNPNLNWTGAEAMALYAILGLFIAVIGLVIAYAALIKQPDPPIPPNEKRPIAVDKWPERIHCKENGDDKGGIGNISVFWLLHPGYETMPKDPSIEPQSFKAVYTQPGMETGSNSLWRHDISFTPYGDHAGTGFRHDHAKVEDCEISIQDIVQKGQAYLGGKVMVLEDLL